MKATSHNPIECRLTAAVAPPSTSVRQQSSNTELQGYAALFYDGTERTEYVVADLFRERIMPGAFDKAIKDRDDVRALFNHEPNQLLGRVSAGTLKLETDKTGLRYTIQMNTDTSIGRDIVGHVRRGDLQGSSFAFRVTQQTWIDADDGGLDIRQIESVQLFDVGPVTYPAYEATSVALNSVNVSAGGRWPDPVRRSETKRRLRGGLDPTSDIVRARLRVLEITK